MPYLSDDQVPDPAVTAATRATMIDLIRTSRQLVPAASALERDQVAANWKAATGAPISASNPAYVHRTDTDRIEYTTDATTWQEFRPHSETGWVDISASTGGAGWTVDSAFKTINGNAWLSINWLRTGTGFTATNLNLRGISSDGPARTLYAPHVINQHAIKTYMGQINPDGSVQAINVSMNTNERLRGLFTWPIG